MILINGKKYACQPCIRGHRASSCKHEDRSLVEIRPKGRPVTQCEKCRQLRKTRKAHVRCLCGELEADNSDDTQSTAEKGSKKSKRNGAHGKQHKTRASSIENLLNPCKCPDDKFCTCCRPMFTEYLSRNYPLEIVEATKKSLGAQLSAAAPMQTPTKVSDPAAPKCPSGPSAPCCKSDATPTDPAAPPSAHAQPAASSSPAPKSSCCPPQPHAGVPHSGADHGSDKPNCDCGCNCRQKLELLVQAIEARIGQPLNINVDEAHGLVDPEEWVESVLSPLSPAFSLDVHSAGESVASGSGSSSSSSIGSSGSGSSTLGMFAAGVLAPAAQASGCCGPKPSPATQATRAASSCCSSSSAAGTPTVAACCQPVAPQQVLPASKSCCDESAEPAKCCGGSEGGCCCKKRKRTASWRPGDPENPEVDEDGALACSCGCRKPFEECKDCLEDLCEEVLLRPTF